MCRTRGTSSFQKRTGEKMSDTNHSLSYKRSCKVINDHITNGKPYSAASHLLNNVNKLSNSEFKKLEDLISKQPTVNNKHARNLSNSNGGRGHVNGKPCFNE